MEPMHTHFASATTGLTAFLSVLIFGTFWRLGCLHAINSDHKIVSALGRAGLFQY